LAPFTLALSVSTQEPEFGSRRGSDRLTEISDPRYLGRGGCPFQQAASGFPVRIRIRAEAGAVL
ncbi:MAG: hypothetical protein ACRDTJ_12580, partial [Pseudonocardiaceae bacterium]